MIGKILKATQDKPCSCPEGKICDGCKKKRVVKPLVYIEQPRHLPVPIKITPYKRPATTVQLLENPRRWSKRKTSAKTIVHNTAKTPWYKRSKSSTQYYVQQEKEKKEKSNSTPLKTDKVYIKEKSDTKRKKTKDNVIAKIKQKRVKTRTTIAKPKADTKSVSVKKENYRQSLSDRFVNCCYRCCCQFYCYLTLFLIIGIALVIFI